MEKVIQPTKELVVGNTNLDSKKYWRRFNYSFWSVQIVGILAVQVGAFLGGAPNASIGALLSILAIWVGTIVTMLVSPALIGYYAYKIGGSKWYFFVGVLGFGGLTNFWSCAAGYLIILLIYKKKANLVLILLIGFVSMFLSTLFLDPIQI